MSSENVMLEWGIVGTAGRGRCPAGLQLQRFLTDTEVGTWDNFLSGAPSSQAELPSLSHH